MPRRSERRPAPGLSAYYSIGPTPKQDQIRNISSTGVYLLTDERWPPGTVVSLTLQKTGPLEESSERRITLPAKAVRCDHDGVGLSFLLPTELDRQLWESLLDCSPQEVEPDDVVREFRLAEAIAFVTRICPGAAEKVRSVLFGGISNIRALSAVEILLKAEEMLAAFPNTEGMRAQPRLVVRILEDGSWAADEWIQHMWSGLLATSCTLDGSDDSSLPLIEVFSQLTATHVHVLAAGCSKAEKRQSEDGSVSSLPLVCTREEIIKTTGGHDLTRIERDLEHMTELGLLERSFKTTNFLALNEANITPSPMALQLYARCNGHRGTTRDFYDVANKACIPAVSEH
ncbi:MAG: PilZ domain-containing protein [Terracidiphilus sp.]